MMTEVTKISKKNRNAYASHTLLPCKYLLRVNLQNIFTQLLLNEFSD